MEYLKNFKLFELNKNKYLKAGASLIKLGHYERGKKLVDYATDFSFLLGNNTTISVIYDSYIVSDYTGKKIDIEDYDVYESIEKWRKDCMSGNEPFSFSIYFKFKTLKNNEVEKFHPFIINIIFIDDPYSLESGDNSMYSYIDCGSYEYEGIFPDRKNAIKFKKILTNVILEDLHDLTHQIIDYINLDFESFVENVKQISVNKFFNNKGKIMDEVLF